MSDRRVVVVTGAARGIGAATARALVAAGAAVRLLDRDAAAVEDTARALAASGDAIGHGCDVRDAGAVAAAFAAIAVADGGIDAVIVNAAVYPRIVLEDTTIADVDRVLDVNLRGAIVTVLGCLPYLREHAAIVCLTSRAGEIDAATAPFQRGFALYGASKAGLDRFVTGVAPELLERGVTITLLCPPGIVRTPGTDALQLGSIDLARAFDVDAVSRPLVWLALEGTTDLAGARLAAVDFGGVWGRV